MRVAKYVNDIDSLAARMLALEEEAFTDFARVFGPRFRAYFIRRGLPVVDAEDLAVSCVTDIALKIEKYKPVAGGGFEAWVFTLARRALFDWWRERRATEPLPDDLPAPLPGEPEEGELAVVEAVRDAVAQLPEADQALIELRDLGGEYTYSEISQQLGLSPQGARVRHFRALKRLKSILEKDPRIGKLLERSAAAEKK